MSQITIQCHLVASEATRRHLWTLMAEKNTPLINELLRHINEHPQLPNWQEKGRIPAKEVKEICQTLRQDPKFSGQPGRFVTSAMTVVNYIYKSWLAIHKRLRYQLEGKTRWLNMLKSDQELVEICGCSLEEIRRKASEILETANLPNSEQTPRSHPTNQRQRKSSSDVNQSFTNVLFSAHQQTNDLLTRSAITYLLKNGCKLPDAPEDPEKFAQYKRKVEIQTERFKEQLESRLPHGRHLTPDHWLETLETATEVAPISDAEAKSWQSELLRESSPLPFPINYETNTDLTWSCKVNRRLCVRFNGFSEHEFQIYCDRRQLHWFQRFLEDQEIQLDGKDQHSSGLFTLRSARISWQEGKGRGNPWQSHRITLACTLETRLWTAEGTEQVKAEKAEEIRQTLEKMRGKKDLKDSQQAFIRRKQATLTRIENPFPRPSKPLYRGQSHIVVGISLGLEKPATAAVTDAITGRVLAYRTIRQLLGENYRLLNRQRQQQHHHAHTRQTAQRQGKHRLPSESELGQYVDRLLASAIVKLAQEYGAGSIAVPQLGNVREVIQSEIQAKAEAKCPEFLEGQKKYAKQYRSSIHRWSYGRLIENVRSQASKIGIVVEEGWQSIKSDPKEAAKELAIAVYKSRC